MKRTELPIDPAVAPLVGDVVTSSETDVCRDGTKVTLIEFASGLGLLLEDNPLEAPSVAPLSSDPE